MKRWTRPDSYIGASWPDYFVFLGQHRDSDSLTRSNFIRGLELIGGESDTVIVVRESHWAVGWVEWIAIHESDTAAHEKAEAILARLESYPVVDESHWSDLEFTEACDYWQRMSVADRVDAIQRSHSDVSVFSARRADLPMDDSGALLDYLRA